MKAFARGVLLLLFIVSVQVTRVIIKPARDIYIYLIFQQLLPSFFFFFLLFGLFDQFMLKIGLFDQNEQPGKSNAKKLAVGDIIVEMVD